MAVIGNYGVSSIIAIPSSPGIKQIEFGGYDTVSTSSSPWTGSEQVQWFPNDGWTGELTMPLMDIYEIGVWEAWLSELRGMANVFYLGHPLRTSPLGCASGLPALSADHAAMATTLNTTGWVTSTARLLIPGDMLQLGQRLHRVLNVVSSDGNGNASINVWPILREAQPSGTALVLKNPAGLFRLAENKRSVTHTETRLGSVTLKVKEAK